MIIPSHSKGKNKKASLPMQEGPNKYYLLIDYSSSIILPPVTSFLIDLVCAS